MRRIYRRTGTLVLGLATLMWLTATMSAQRGEHGGGGGHAGGGHAAASVGSVHFAGRAAPARVAPAVRAGAVRSEHYAGLEHAGAYRNPYRDEYFRHFRPGYRPFVLGGAQYYGTTAYRSATNRSC
jgi:hypothetical protein